MDPRDRLARTRAGGPQFPAAAALRPDSVRPAPPMPSDEPTAAVLERFAGGELRRHMRRFGDVAIAWWLPAPFETPFGLNVDGLDGHAYFVTLTWIVYRFGPHTLVIPPGFVFDGASVPRIFWCVPGFSPLGRHVWAALAHDWICEHPEELPRIIGDAIFGHLLEQLRIDAERHKPPRERTYRQRAANAAMYLAVRAWSTYRSIRGELSTGA